MSYKRYTLMTWSPVTSELNNYLGYQPDKVRKQRVILFSSLQPEDNPQYLAIAHQVTRKPVGIIGSPDESEWVNERITNVDGNELLAQLVAWGFKMPPQAERRDDV